VNDAGRKRKRKTEILADHGGMQHKALSAAPLPAHVAHPVALIME
jgi:hypothetical protein